MSHTLSKFNTQDGDTLAVYDWPLPPDKHIARHRALGAWLG